LAILRERLFLNSESEDLWLSATCAVFETAGDGLAHQFPGADFRSGSINGRSGFFREPGNYGVVSRERENETQADERVEARHCYAETDLGHSGVRGELELSRGHGTSPPQLSRPNRSRAKS
jgi:hypothetical protein